MKDLDFDELDRAVNSLIGATPSEATTPTTAAPAVVPASVAQVPAAASPAPIATPTQPLAAKRSSGRFMDVVHPSSDMRPDTAPTPVEPVLRVGVDLQPISHPTQLVSASSVPPIVNTPTDTQAPEKSAKSEWPDPLDMSTTPAEDTTDSVPVPADSPINEEISASLSQPNTPLESPFIPDAKVEKRPLGAFSSEPTLSPDGSLGETEKDETAPSIPIDNRDDHPIESDIPLPAELQNDLLSIEANESATPPTPPLAVDENAPVSIPQQYSEQPSTGDKPAGAIFDVEAYRKPIAKQKKKTSAWLYIVWILLLVIVGAGAGAAVYFFVLPSL